MPEDIIAPEAVTIEGQQVSTSADIQIAPVADTSDIGNPQRISEKTNLDDTIMDAFAQGAKADSVSLYLSSEFGMTPEESTAKVNASLQAFSNEGIDQGIAPSQVRAYLAAESGLSPERIEALVPLNIKDIEVPELAPIGGEVSEGDLSLLASQARNVYDLQMPFLGGLKASFDENRAEINRYKQIEIDHSVAIANTLRKLGKNVIVSTGDQEGVLAGVLFEQLENGELREVDEGILDSIFTMEYELAASLGMGIAGYQLSIAAATSAFGGKYGWLTKALGVTGGIAASAAGASVGRALDITHNALRVKADYDANLVIDRMKDAGIFTATTEVLGTGVFWLGAKTIKGLGRAWDKLVGGNKEGAYRALKDLMGLDDNQVDEIIKAWEGSTGQKAQGFTRAAKALRTVPLTEPGGEGVVRAASGLNAKASAAISRTISNRAKDLMQASNNLTSDNIGAVIKDDLDTYTRTVKDFYEGIKVHGTDTLKDTEYRFDYDKLAVQPLLDTTKDKITNPALQEQFGKYIAKIEKLGKGKPKATDQASELILPAGVKKEITQEEAGKLRSFGDLLDLRETINAFKSNANLKSIAGRDKINEVLKNIDDEIARAAKLEMDDGSIWLKEWNRAKIEYSKMKTLEGNVLYKALTSKGANVDKIVKQLSHKITALDGTFMQVIAKLPPKTRAAAEGAVFDTLVNKHSIGDVAGLQATNFTNLDKELRHVGFTDSKSRALKRVVHDMAKVYKNDVNLAQATGQVAKPQFQSYLTTDPTVRFKYEVASQVFNYIKRMLPGSQGDNVALTTNLAKVLAKPTDSISVNKLLKLLPKDPQLESKIRQLSLEMAKFGEKENYPKVTVYRVGIPGRAHKAIDGKLGKGIYWTTDKKVANERAKAINGKVMEEDVLPSRIAGEANIKDILGVDHIDESMIKDNEELVELLKDSLYDGISLTDEVLIFK